MTSESSSRQEGGATTEAGPRHSTPLPALSGLLPLLLAAAAAVSWYASLGSIHPYQVTAIGLVAQLSVLWWLGVALVATAVVLELRREVPAPW